MDAESLFWLAMNAYHEARGETYDGIKAVCHVVLNRARSRNKSVKEVVLQPWQFSWANNGARPAVKEYDAFAKCFSAAVEAVEEQKQGNTMFGADHYHTVEVNPSWNRKMKQIVRIGAHIFYKS